MQRRWRATVRLLTVTAAMGGVLLGAGRLAAQTPPPGTAGSLAVPTVNPDESARLFASPKGEMFRLSQTEGDPRSGGGTLQLDVAGPQDTWQSALLLRSSDAGVSIRDGDLAFGPNGQMAMVYRWWRTTPRAKQLRVALSEDGGKTWSEPTTQVDGSGMAFDPRVVWTKGKGLVVAWTDERRRQKLFDVYARRSPDGGVTWEPEQLLSRFPRNGPADIYVRPRILSDGDKLWTIWVGLRGTRSELYLNRSTDGGKTWTDPVALSGESRSIFGQILLRAGSHLLAIWHDTPGQADRVFAASSSDDGQTWTAPVRVDHLAAEGPAVKSSAAVLKPDGEALVVWQDARNGRDDIFMARSTDGGRTWGTEDLRMDMDDAGTGVSRFPRLALAPDGRVALAWEDDRAGYEAVYVRVRSAGTKREWGPEILVTPPSGKLAARLPDAVWGPAGLLLVWQIWDNTLAPARIEKRSASRLLPLK